MFSMWKADLYRIVKSKGFKFYWFAIIFTYGISVALKQGGGLNFGAGPSVTGLDDTLKMDIVQVGSNFTFFYLFMMPIFGIIVSDFSEKTIKNTISSVINRKKYFIVKYVLTMLYLFVTFVFSNVAFYAINRVVNGSCYASEFGEFMKCVGYQLPILMGFSSLLILVGFIVRKAALFNAICMLTPMLYTSIALIIYQAGAKDFAMKYLLKYELSTALAHVVTLNDMSYVQNCTILGFVLLVVTFILGYVSFSKFELK